MPKKKRKDILVTRDTPDDLARSAFLRSSLRATGTVALLGVAGATSGCAALKELLIPQKMEQIKEHAIDTPYPLNLPLYDTSKITWLGYFLVPRGSTDRGEPLLFGQPHGGFAFSGQGSGGITFNPDGDGGNGSLFLCGASLNNDGHNHVIAEIDIPEIRTSKGVRAKMLQPFTLVCGAPGVQEDMYLSQGFTGGNYNETPISGLHLHDGKLYITISAAYFSQYSNYCMYVRDSLDLETGNLLGPYYLSSTMNNRWTSLGLGDAIPDEFQSVFFGNKAFGGGSGQISIASNYSFGPSILGWNPDDLEGEPALGGCEVDELVWWFGLGGRRYMWDPVPDDSVGNPWPFRTREQFGSQTVPPASVPFPEYNHSCMNRMSFMVPRSRTVFCFGHHANAFYDTGGAEMGIGQCLGSDQEYRAEIFWLFDARDLIEPRTLNNGPFPYDHHKMNFSFRDQNQFWSCAQKRYATFDPATRRLYVYCSKDGDFIPEEDRRGMPVIHVLEFPE